MTLRVMLQRSINRILGIIEIGSSVFVALQQKSMQMVVVSDIEGFQSD
jgi:hypothetical protein